MRKFRCSADDDILLIERVRTADGEPVVYCIDKILCKYLPKGISYEQESLFENLHNQANRDIAYAIARIEPLGYHEKVSPILQCESETALLVLKQMHFDKSDEPIFYSINYFRSDKFSFHVLRKRLNF